MRIHRLPIAALTSAGLFLSGAAPAADPPPFETPNAPKKEPSAPRPPAFDVDGTPPPRAEPPPSSPPSSVEGRVPMDLPSEPSPPPPPPSPPPSPSPSPSPPPRMLPIEGGDAAPAPPPSRSVQAAPPRAVKAAAPKPPPKKKSAIAKTKARAEKRAARASSGGPAATYPGFRLLENGGSRVFVKIEGKVGVTERKGAGQFVVALPGVSVPSRNDRRPLDTSFFPTPVSRVRLVPHEGGADLVIELKQPSEMSLRVQELRDGVIVMIDFPAQSGGSSGALR